MIRTTTSLAAFLACTALACAHPEPKSQDAIHADGVPANSLSEKRLADDGKKTDDGKKPETKPGATEAKADPSQPYTQPVGAGAGSGDEGTPPPPGGKEKPGKATGKITKAECNQVFDKYLDLAIGSDARLEGVPPELIQQAKAQARQQKGDPCEKEGVARSKYNCAMAATSTQQWEKCMK